jgi:hypothetical protein
MSFLRRQESRCTATFLDPCLRRGDRRGIVFTHSVRDSKFEGGRFKFEDGVLSVYTCNFTLET